MHVDSERVLRFSIGLAVSGVFHVMMLFGGYLTFGDMTASIYIVLPIVFAFMIPTYAHLFTHHDYWPGRRGFEDGFLAGVLLLFFFGTLYVATTPLAPHDNYHFPEENPADK